MKIDFYTVTAEHTMDDGGEVTHKFQIKPYQVGYSTWMMMENALAIDAKDKYLSKSGSVLHLSLPQ